MLLCALMLLMNPLGAGAAAADGKTHMFVVSGVLLNSGNGRLINEFTDYLSASSGYTLRPVFVESYRQLSNKLRDHPDALGWNCGAPYVEDRREHGQQLIAVPLFQGKPLYHSLILARSGRQERRLLDFRDQVFVYSDPRSNSGYLSPSHSLLQAGERMDDFFRLQIHAGSHENSIAALLDGLADVAAVDEYVWVEYQRANPAAASRLVELERMGPFPFTPIVAGEGMDDAQAKRLLRALLSMGEDERGRRLLGHFGLDGFVQVDADFYRPIASMLERVRAGTESGGTR